MAWETIDKGLIKKLTAQVIGDVSFSDGPLEAPCMIKGKGVIYCYSIMLKQFVKLERGTEIFIISDELGDKERMLVFANPYIVAMPFEEIEQIGFN